MFFVHSLRRLLIPSFLVPSGFAALVFSALLAIFIQAQQEHARVGEKAILGLLRNERLLSNPYLLSQAITDIAELKLVKCVVMSIEGSEPPYIDLSSGDSSCSNANIKKIALRANNGSIWHVSFQVVESTKFLFTVALAAALAGLSIAFLFFAMRMKQRHDDVILSEKAAIVNLAQQVVHDVASPLGALRVAAYSLRKEDTEISSLLTAATQRIADILADLENTHLNKERESISKVANILSIVEEVIREKQQIYGLDRIRTANKHDNLDGFVPITTTIDRISIARVISNITQNAIEASSHTVLPVLARVRANQNNITVLIVDRGKGISKKITKNLFKKGFSTKSSSAQRGLGLFHAKETLLKTGATIRICSKSNIWTAVRIQLPRNLA